jgi:feruloyl esterase
MISEGTIKYLAYDPNPVAGFKLADFKFDAANFAATTRLHGLYDATDPDLSAFANSGGKLILWHGLADPHISPLNTVAYYGAMQRTLGTDKVTQFARLFLFPGGAHCGGGEGPFDMDLLSAIMDWVENSKAPNVIVASHSAQPLGPMGVGPPPDIAGIPRGGPGEPPPGMLPGGPGGPPPGMKPPGTDDPKAPRFGPRKVDRTRPVYPYPLVAQYTGQGSIDDAANFKAAAPSRPWPSTFAWLGESLYSPHYETWCTPTSTDTKADCKSAP